MAFQNGDRVRIRQPSSEYTGCRGTIRDATANASQGVLPLGHMVAIDGENGVTRPFLIQHLERLAPRRVTHPEGEQGELPLWERGRR